MQVTVPLVLIAIASAALVLVRDERLGLAALALQWLGLIMYPLSERAQSTRALPALDAAASVELLLAVVCGAILFFTLRAGDRPLRNTRYSPPRGHPEATQYAIHTSSPAGTAHVEPGRSSLADYAWRLAIVLAGGVAGFALALLFTTAYRGGTGAEPVQAAFWVLLSALIVLVLDGARSPFKAIAGHLALFNAVALMVYSLSPGAPTPATLAVLALGRIGLVVVLAYGWLLAKAAFADSSLFSLFDAREGRATPETALVVMERSNGPEMAAPESTVPQGPEGTTRSTRRRRKRTDTQSEDLPPHG